ncbi:uncharacterized protein LOC135712029 [Ochlerotatus camptorhynchus]|uniref:uncharacterized protein LOC135712029 n=1 Tax=Ochlerotatus camptorhynchus TaxID=644619 RepID=UPI0031E30BCE
MLSRGGFQLRKWASNCETVLEGVPHENRALQHSIDLDRDQTIKTLVLHWEPASDRLKYKIVLLLPPNAVLTKRLTLSYIAQLFDPLGLVGPVVVMAKAFMQTLWTLRYENGTVWEWDRELISSLRDKWINDHSNLPALNELRIDRFVLLPKSVEIVLHLFSDASDIGYGTCAYLRSIDNYGQIKIALLTSKSRIAPLKKQSTPRLELFGALLFAELYLRIAASLQMTFSTIYWTDSTTVINWLEVTPSTWTTCVANRVSKIQHARQHCTWKHIAGLENPADVISRGCLASDIIYNTLWWRGPEWLQKEKEYWPVPGQQCGSTDNCNIDDIDEYVAKFSNYSKMKLLHAAPQLMVNTIRIRYWLLGGRSVARQIVHKCVTCVRARPKLIEQFMSELPAARVTASRPFSKVGIDFWEPIYIQPRHRRDAPMPPIKAYVAVFVCSATKAVVNLTTAKFLQAFRRFVARRGLCSDAYAYSDNGKNFVGAANELKRLLRSKEHK